MDNSEVYKDDIHNYIEPDEKVQNAHWCSLGGVTIVPLEFFFTPMEESMDVMVTLWQSFQAAVDKVFLAVGRFSNKLWSEWVASLVNSEVDWPASDAWLHPLKHQGLHDNVDGTEEEWDNIEVPIRKCITEVRLVVGEHRRQGHTRTRNKDKCDPVLDAQGWVKDQVGRKTEHDCSISPYTILQICTEESCLL